MRGLQRATGFEHFAADEERRIKEAVQVNGSQQRLKDLAGIEREDCEHNALR